jgi:hypothetical protein
VNKQNTQAELNNTKDVNIIGKNWTLLPQQEIPDFNVSKGPKSLEFTIRNFPEIEVFSIFHSNN